MTSQLRNYVQRPLGPFQRGVSDCCGWVAGWAEVVAGTFPGEDLRGPWSDREAVRLLQDHGGVLGLMGNVLEADGWTSVDDPEDGDIVVIEHGRGCLGETVGIWSAGKVLSVHEGGGLVSLAPDVVKGGWRWA